MLQQVRTNSRAFSISATISCLDFSQRHMPNWRGLISATTEVLQNQAAVESHPLRHIFNSGSSPGTQHAAYVWNWRAWGQSYKVWRGRKPADQGGVHLLPCGYSYCFELSG